MPVYRHCMNCHNNKTPDRYRDYLCAECETSAKEAEALAATEGQDPGAARKDRLASLSPSAMGHKHPGMGFDRMDTRAITERMGKEDANPRDPRYTGR